MDTIVQKSIQVAEDSPWFSGHFPDNPILPGIAQLEMIVKLVSEAAGIPLKLTGMSRVKFRKIVRPGDLLDIQVARGTKKDQYTFKILGENEDVCSGSIFLAQ
ncbi:MAG: hypothetical protein D3908_07090 [Candidatus Electrothrix sp. AUS4]|nr:hypothetical protein [Candidatus Electrothrix sp. AUS4]